MALNAKVMLGIAASILVAFGAALDDEEEVKQEGKAKLKKKKAKPKALSSPKAQSTSNE